MQKFAYEYATKVFFGEGAAKEHLAGAVSGYGDNVLLAWGGGSVKKNGIYDEVRSILENAGKISICFEIPHESGSLYNILSHMIYNNLNMTKIESRPIPERNWEYRFFVDFEGNLNDSGVKNALRGIEQETKRLRIFGNY